MAKSKIEKELLQWNITFPLDRWFREKYKIPLFSRQHLDTNPLDILAEYIEDEMFYDAKNGITEEVKEGEDIWSKFMGNVKNEISGNIGD